MYLSGGVCRIRGYTDRKNDNEVALMKAAVYKGEQVLRWRMFQIRYLGRDRR